jgi:hypothetical protein
VFVLEAFFHAHLAARCGDAPGGKMPPDTAGKDACRYRSVPVRGRALSLPAFGIKLCETAGGNYSGSVENRPAPTQLDRR